MHGIATRDEPHSIPAFTSLYMVPLHCVYVWQSSRVGTLAAVAIGCASIGGVSLWAAVRRSRKTSSGTGKEAWTAPHTAGADLQLEHKQGQAQEPVDEVPAEAPVILEKSREPERGRHPDPTLQVMMDTARAEHGCCRFLHGAA